jgi:hypothetical protein
MLTLRRIDGGLLGMAEGVTGRDGALARSLAPMDGGQPAQDRWQRLLGNSAR